MKPRTPLVEARELRRRVEEVRMRAEQFAVDGLPRFAAAARQRCAELRAQADRLDLPPPMFRPANPGRFLPERRP